MINLKLIDEVTMVRVGAGWLVKTKDDNGYESLIDAGNDFEQVLADALGIRQNSAAPKEVADGIVDYHNQIAKYLKDVDSLQKIAAIKSIRMITGAGLKEAKDAIDTAAMVRYV